MRLNKRLVELGLSESRRKADRAINDGIVSVNGQSATLGQEVGEADNILLRGKSGESKAPIYVAFNKPRGYVCSHAQQEVGQTIFTLLPKNFASLKIVGRLDSESEGLVILSSDGDFVQALSHPSSGKEKEYVVALDIPLTGESLKKLGAGVKIDGSTRKFKSLSKISPTTFRVILSEGRNRQIRRMFEGLGYNVIKLQRIRVGKLSLGTLPSGKHKVIQRGEVL